MIIEVGVILAWYDIWIGVYWDRKKRRLYMFPIPCVGAYIQFDSVLERKKQHRDYITAGEMEEVIEKAIKNGEINIEP